MEQSANPIARLRTLTRTIQAVTEDTSLQAYIWLLIAAAPSDSFFSCAGHKLTYLLTYLLSMCANKVTQSVLLVSSVPGGKC